MREIDARGLSCPAPVLQAKAAVEKERVTELKVVVDNEAAKENVSRFLKSRGFETSVETIGGDYAVIGACDACAAYEPEPVENPAPDTKKIMVLIATDRLGYGDDDLGKQLLVNFIKTLDEMGGELWRLVFVNNGVKLTVDGSEVLPVLRDYEAEGLHILVCGTCLNHFDLLDKKQVGDTTNMLDIVTAMQLADKVINI